jgi:hypothetical protein
MQLLWAVRTVRHDMRQILGGVRAFRRHARSPDDAQVGLSVFSAASHVVTRGVRCGYDIAIVNLTAHAYHCTLRIDFWPAERREAPQELYASFEKSLILVPRGNSPVAMTFDWISDAHFVLAGQHVRADAFVAGSGSSLGNYIVRASLLDAARQPMEALDLVQHLAS